MPRKRLQGSVHDALTELFFARMEGKDHIARRGVPFYSSVNKNKTYTVMNRKGEILDGELDVFALKEGRNKDYIVIIEVKTTRDSKSYKKAREQLAKAEKWVKGGYGEGVKCFKIFAYQNKGRLERELNRPYYVEWIR